MVSRTKAYLYIVWLSLLLIVAASGCNSTGFGDNADTSGGGMAFNLSWESAARQGTQMAQPQLVTGNPCLNYQIEWIGRGGGGCFLSLFGFAW